MDQSSSTTVHARRWCESVLGLPDDWDTRDLLQQLTQADYFVPAEHVNAMQMLSSPESRSLSQDTLRAADFWKRFEQTDRAIVRYSEMFFDIPPTLRRQRWHALAAEATEFPQLRNWLQRLEPALGITKIPPTDDDPIDRFVDLCCQSFVAPAVSQARQRQAMTHQYCEHPLVGESVVQYLLVQYPQFVSAVAPWIDTLQELYFYESSKNDLLSMPTVAESVAPAPKSSNRSGSIFVAAIVVAAIRLFRLFDTSSPSVSDDRFIKPPHRSLREFQTDPDLGEERNRLTEDGKKSFKRLQFKRNTDGVIKLNAESEQPKSSRSSKSDAPADSVAP